MQATINSSGVIPYRVAISLSSASVCLLTRYSRGRPLGLPLCPFFHGRKFAIFLAYFSGSSFFFGTLFFFFFIFGGKYLTLLFSVWDAAEVIVHSVLLSVRL